MMRTQDQESSNPGSTMDDKRLRQIRQVFVEARQRPSSERSRYLAEVCAGDPELEAELASLLECDDEPASGHGRSPDETATSPRMQSPAGNPPEIPDYELCRQIGRGGIGEVWLARNRIDGSYCAVKIIAADALSEIDGLREYRHRVAQHDHLVPIEHVGRVGAHCYYVMPLADDATSRTPVFDPQRYEPMVLARVLNRRGRLPAIEVIEIGRQMLAALGHLHAHGACHGDVKPANILRLRQRWQLADHGLVANVEDHDPRGCTPDFCPPEGPGAAGADLYALGATLFQLATGESPRRVRDFVAGRSNFPGRDRNMRELARVIGRACARDPAQRFSHADEMSAALQPATRDTRTWWPIATSVVVGALTLTVIIVLMGRNPGAKHRSINGQAVEVRLDVRHYRKQATETDKPPTPLGIVGSTSPAVFRNDDVRVDLQFDQPLHCFLIALTPDGGEILCFPDDDATVPPPVTRLRCPDEKYFGLTEGTGLQAFVLVASADPLPAYGEWRRGVGDLPWTTTEGSIPWQYDGLSFEPMGAERGVRDRGGPPTALVESVRLLEAAPGVDLVRAIAFPVKPVSDDGS